MNEAIESGVTPSGDAAPRVFISYSHDSPEHKARVLELSERLRGESEIDCELDQYTDFPEEGWPRWMLRRVEEARFVLVVATETYHRRFRGEELPGVGLGAIWEGGVITQNLYNAQGRNSKFVPVIFEERDQQHIPEILKGATWYRMFDQYDSLVNLLRGVPTTPRSPIGGRRGSATRATPAHAKSAAAQEEQRRERQLGIEISNQLAPDALAWLVSLGRFFRRTVGSARARRFASLPELYAALAASELADGDLVRIQCRPSPFGPFLREHFLPAVTGLSADYRLGPSIVSPLLPMAIIAQSSSHLTPVGLYPVLDESVRQVCLYPIGSTACGFISFVPGVSEMVPRMPALISARFAPLLGQPVELTGRVRLLSEKSLIDAGFSSESYESFRQLGQAWFFDVDDDCGDCKPLSEDPTAGELWGGLYACGHVEAIGAGLPVADFVEAVAGPISAQGYSVHIGQNQAGAREAFILAKGFRAVVGTQYPAFSLHMDVDVGRHFGECRRQFDNVANGVLANIRQVCATHSLDLKNPDDLDFSYSNSARAYTVLKSLGAEYVQDPIAIGIRDWHRRRGL